MLTGNKNERFGKLMVFVFVALMAAFWLGVLWFAVYGAHWLWRHP